MILPHKSIEIAISRQYDRVTACTDDVSVGMDGLGLAKCEIGQGTKSGRKAQGIRLAHSSLALLQIIAIYHQSRRKTQRLEALTHLSPSPPDCPNVAAGCSFPF